MTTEQVNTSMLRELAYGITSPLGEIVTVAYGDSAVAIASDLLLRICDELDDLRSRAQS